MKKFLQKTLALLALCLVSMGAMAQETELSIRFSSDGLVKTDGNVTIQGVDTWWSSGSSINVYTDNGTVYGHVNVTCEDGFEISRVEFTNCASSGWGATANFGQYFFEVNNKGEMHDEGQWAYWTGAASSLRFGVNSDFMLNDVTVYYHTAVVSTTFDFDYANPASGALTEPMSSGIYVYHNQGTLAFADGKSHTDINVNGTPVSSATSNNGYLWISYNVTEDGTFVLTIPEGTFVNGAGKTNTTFTQTYTMTLPGFGVSAAEWATFCMTKNWTMPTGYTGYVVSDIVDGHAILSDAFAAGSLVPSYCAVLVNGPEVSKVTVNTVGGNYDAPTNYLYSSAPFGNVEKEFTASNMWLYMGFLNDNAPCDTYLYKFCDGENGLGFYWDSVDGQTLTCQPYRAFLVVPESKYSSNGLKIRFAEDEATGINAVATENADAIYNLQGQRVNATAAGIYVKNGKKFIVK